MRRRPAFRSLVLVASFAALLPSAALSAKRSARHPRAGVSEKASHFVGSFWQAVVTLFAPSGSIMDPDGKPIMDPNGYLHLPGPGATTQSGSIMDPDG